MGVEGGARDSDRDGRFLGPSSSFLSLLPRTLRSSSAVAPASEEEEIELLKKFFKYEVIWGLMDSTKLVESAKKVLSSSSELSDVDNRKPFEDKGRMTTLDGQDGAMTRRQGLGRKKAQFTFRPNMR
ncbi:hypothetical protein QJS10_CPB22g00983 [Acorus calamus]|uniref:Uncharacterized protein n=1 Tax=Acorus calamus TaxID=4465 RepID=A0AAV9C221_ACOCL|nr:hypothetical protein QJS10_CPB22g00983 [Acorus calamus]